MARWGFEEGDLIAPGRIALRRLGGGEQYEVYLVWDDRLLAIAVAKMIRPDRVEDAGVLAGLRREAATLRRLAHPVIVRLFDSVEEGDRPHLLLEHLEGPTLRSLLRRYGPLQLPQVLPLALHLCAALHYMATSDTVHLDLKPGNIVMGAPPRLLDLSLARTSRDARGLDHVVGTRLYMAPEQCEPGRRGPIGFPADIWGLGVSVYQAITGSLPFGEPDGVEYPQLDADPEPFPAEVPGPLGEAILACLAREPRERPAAHELATLLEPFVAAVPRPRLVRKRPKHR